MFYNGVTAGMNANTLKDSRRGWVADRLPGPGLPAGHVIPPDPNDQVGIIDGNSSGIIIDEIDERYMPGDEVLAAVYSGTVMTIPDFAYDGRRDRDDRHDPEPQQRDHDAASRRTTRSRAWSTTFAFKDWGDAGQPVRHARCRR